MVLIMLNPRASLILVIAIIVQSFHGALAKTIMFRSEEHEENVGLSFGEPMDKCGGPESQNTVRLVQTGLRNVGENFVNSVNVKSITLEDNKIKSISLDAFRAVPNLSCLNIRNNKMSLGNLTALRHDNLEKLNLAENRISYSVGQKWEVYLPRLTHLDFSNNAIDSLPPRAVFQSSFPSLTHFYFSDNAFKFNESLNSIFYYLPPSTQHFYMKGNRGRIYIPTLLPNISTLILNNNNIASGSISSVNLKVLSLRKCNNLNIDASNLVDLDLSSNGLVNLRESMFVNIKSLQRLSLEENLLSSFSVLNELHSLTDLSLNFNNITSITSQSIGNLTNLRRLHLRGNRIALIEENAFSKSKLLEKLDLAENRLTTLPSNWIIMLTELVHLDLRSNLFITFEDMSLNFYTNLQHVFVGKNNFTQIEPSSLTEMSPYVIIHVQ